MDKLAVLMAVISFSILAVAIVIIVGIQVPSLIMSLLISLLFVVGVIKAYRRKK